MYVRALPKYGTCKDLIPYEQHPGVKKGTPVLLRTYPNLIYWELFINRQIVGKSGCKISIALKKRLSENNPPLVSEHRGDEEGEWGKCGRRSGSSLWNYKRDQRELPWNKEEMLHTHYFIFISSLLSNICPPTMWHCLLFIANSTDFCTELKWEICRNVLMTLKKGTFSKILRVLLLGLHHVPNVARFYCSCVDSKTHQPVCCQAHALRSSFSAGSQMCLQCNRFQTSTLNPKKWHQQLFLFFHSAFCYLWMWFMLFFLTFSGILWHD